MRLLVKEAAPLHDLMSVALLGGCVHVYARECVRASMCLHTGMCVHELHACMCVRACLCALAPISQGE